MKRILPLIVLAIFSLALSKLSHAKTAGLVDLSTAAEKSVEAVVHVRTKVTQRYYKRRGRMDLFDYLFGSPSRSRGYQEFQREQDHSSGSGVVITKDGYIITNNHVVNGASKVEVVLHDKRKYEAQVVGVDAQTDIALLKIKAKNLRYCAYGNSDKIKLGEWVLAVGYPYTLSSTVTAGIVSAKATKLDGQMSLNSFIQTDAAVNPGNSGGALVDKNGKLIGMNTMIYSPTGSYSGYSFAVPTSVIKEVVADLIKYKEVKRAYLGIVPLDIDAEMAQEYDLPLEGILVARLFSGGAADAGIEQGDVIQSIDGDKTSSSSKLFEIMSKKKPGDRVNVTVVREGKKKTFWVQLKARSASGRR